MFERADRGIRSGLVLRLVMVISLVAVGAGLSLWWLRNDLSLVTPQNQSAQDPSSLRQLSRLDEPVTVTLCYPGDGLLSTGSVGVKRQPDVQAQAREVLRALFTDPRSSHAAILADVQLGELYFDASGTAYIDLVLKQKKELKASAGEELLALYVLVNTLTLNFEEIKRVFLLLDGKEAQTLAGHMDLSRTFMKRMDLVKP